jgi:hypothetical protein
MRVAIAIPIYLKGKGEQPAYDKCIEHYSLMAYPIVVCGSEGRISSRFTSYHASNTVSYKEVPQMHGTIASAGDESLRNKFNDSLAALPDSDWYCLVGADDFVPKSVFEQLENLNPNEVIMAGVRNGQPLMVYNLLTDESMNVTLSYKVDLLPGVNIFSKAAMKAVKGRPYQLKGCETGAEKLFADIGKVVGLDGYVVMLKYKDELNTYHKIKRVHHNVPLTKQQLNQVYECIKVRD